MNNKEIKYTSFILTINILFITIMSYPIILGIIIHKQFFSFDFYIKGLLIMILSIIFSSLFYYVCWKKTLDHHKIVFWTLVFLVIFYFIVILFKIFLRSDMFIFNFIIEGILIGLLVYVAEIELVEKEH